MPLSYCETQTVFRLCSRKDLRLCSYMQKEADLVDAIINDMISELDLIEEEL